MNTFINCAALVSFLTFTFADETVLHFDKDTIENKAHLQEHLDQVADLKTEDMNSEQLQFHYFKLHDADNNNKLDGIEILKSMMDHHHQHVKKGDKKDIQKPPQMSDAQYEEILDKAFSDNDMDNDGYIDYLEWKAAHRNAEKH